MCGGGARTSAPGVWGHTQSRGPIGRHSPDTLLFLLLSERVLCGAAATVPPLGTWHLRSHGAGRRPRWEFANQVRGWGLGQHHRTHQEAVYTVHALGTNVIDMFPIASVYCCLLWSAPLSVQSPLYITSHRVSQEKVCLVAGPREVWRPWT